MGLDEPWHKQLLRWSISVLHGDFGYSWSHHRPVREVVQEALPATMTLAVAALILNMLLGCTLGVISGVMHDRFVGRAINFIAILIYAIPPFWLAIFLIYIFSSQLHLLPPSGFGTFILDNTHWYEIVIDRLRHLILPATVLGIVGAAATFRFVRDHVISQQREQYITFATAKGLSWQRIFFKHVLANTLIPVVTLLGLYLPMLLGGAFIIEVIFAWPGMGRITYDAIFAKDFPLLMAVNFFVAVMVLVGNFIADLLYNLIDPRVRID
ncbi:ABC transporter permease [candidate division KSB1 bacterium]|nr:ABC transporter permease [candidate division KSB1 bacterium]